MPPSTNNQTRYVNNDLVALADWQVIERDFDGQPNLLPKGNLLLPMEYWLSHGESLGDRLETTGVWIDSDEDVEKLGNECQKFSVIGVNFPAFTDGRGFSIGRLLKERYQYQGELRAIGNTMRDQWFFLKLCGFDAYQLPDTVDSAASLKPLDEFSVTYQTSVERPEPLFRRR